MKTIVVAVDFSNATPGVLEMATQMAKAFGATLRLFHVVEPEPSYTAYGFTPDEFPALHAYQEEAKRRAGEKLETLLQQVKSSLPDASCQIAEGVLQGGLSGVAFSRDVTLVSRVTQGCQPIGPMRRITACERNLVTALDAEPALACLLRDTGISLDEPQRAMRTLRGTLVGLSEPREALLARGGQFGADTRVRHLIGLDPGQHGVAVADSVEPGMQLAFCQRDVQAARRDLVRICTEIRDELAPEPALALAAADEASAADPLARMAGAIYISCAGRGGPHFGAPSAELQIVRRALGDVPLVGFFAGGEIGHHHLYGYTGVLTVFVGGA